MQDKRVRKVKKLNTAAKFKARNLYSAKYYYDDHIKENAMGSANRTHEEMRNACKFLVTKPEG
jgi:hypothetical protein